MRVNEVVSHDDGLAVRSPLLSSVCLITMGNIGSQICHGKTIKANEAKRRLLVSLWNDQAERGAENCLGERNLADSTLETGDLEWLTTRRNQESSLLFCYVIVLLDKLSTKSLRLNKLRMITK